MWGREREERFLFALHLYPEGVPRGSLVRNLPAKAGDAGSIPESGRSLGEGNGNPLQYSCLGNLTDIGAWRATADGVAKSGTTKELKNSNN